MSKRIFITGCKGQLGNSLTRVFARNFQTLGAARDPEKNQVQCDITQLSEIERCLEDFQPDLLINAAAYTNVDLAESDEQTAFSVNADAVRLLAEATYKRRIPMVHFSTDFVFDGSGNRPWTPQDQTSPINVYGKSKLAGEKLLTKTNPHSLIIRTSWLYGPGGTNFVSKILELARQHTSLNIVEDEVGKPTHTGELAESVLSFLTRQQETSWWNSFQNHEKVLHAAGRQTISRYDFAKDILACADIHGVQLHPVTSASFCAPAKRPLNSTLDTSSFDSAAAFNHSKYLLLLRNFIYHHNKNL